MPRWREHRVRRRGNAGRAGDGRGSLALPARTVVRVRGDVCVRRALCSSSARLGDLARAWGPPLAERVSLRSLPTAGLVSNVLQMACCSLLWLTLHPPSHFGLWLLGTSTSMTVFSGLPLGLGSEPERGVVAAVIQEKKPSGEGRRFRHSGQPFALGAAMVWRA